MDKIVKDNLNLSNVEINDLKSEIFTIYDSIARISGEEYQEEEDSIIYYFHSLKLTKNKDEICEVFDCSTQLILDQYYLASDDEVVITEYAIVKNKFLLYIIKIYLNSLL